MRRAWLLFTLAFVVACARAAAPPAANPADWRPAPDAVMSDCNDSEPSSDLEIGVLRERCGDNVYSACSVLAQKSELAGVDGALVRAKLESRCNVDARCGCSRLGEALLWNRTHADDLRAAALLDASCHRGALDACDVMLLQAEVCAVNADMNAATALCNHLREQHRVPAPPEAHGPKALPAPLRRCFIVRASARNELACAADANVVAAWGFPTEPSESLITPGAVVCFASDRMSTKATSTSRWNQRLTTWEGPSDHDVVTDRATGITLEAVDWNTTTIEQGCAFAELVAASGRWVDEAVRVPRVETICGRMQKCVAAVARMYPSPHVEDDSPPVELPDDLLGCADYQARMTKLVPSPPAECQ